jgi:1,4-alpha-glucan branching enzyme
MNFRKLLTDALGNLVEPRASSASQPPESLPGSDEPPARVWDSLLEGETRSLLENDALPAFLAKQRWFAAKSRTLKSTRFLDWTVGSELPETSCLTLVEVAFDSGRPDTYLLPLGLATGAEADRLEREAPKRVLRRFEGFGVVYDSLGEPDLCLALLDSIENSRSIPAGSGTIKAFPTSAFAEARGPAGIALSVASGKFEQSNSAVLYGDRLILKFFRRLDRGINPDFEIGRFLSEKTKFDRIPKTVGAILHEQSDSEPLMLGILQGLVPNQGSGWDHALQELKAYFEKVESQQAPPDLEAFEGRPPLELAGVAIPDEARQAIGRYLNDAATLGRRTAELHLALASDPTDPAFAPELISSVDLEHLAEEIRQQVENSLDVLRSTIEKLPEAIRGQALLVIDQTPDSLERLETLPGLKLDATKIRVHGDYHLGQVLRTDDDFVILDFEGEPARPLRERVQKVSPMKDVVGMIRSFDYAAFAALFSFAGDRSDRFERLEPWAKSWRTWVSSTFLNAYLDTAKAASFLPRDPSHLARLLNAFLVEKALYELQYELNNRPDWVRIPLQGIAALLGPVAPPDPEAFGDLDLYLINEGTYERSYEKLGAHPASRGDVLGCRFAVWAPNARQVSVIGEFNGWKDGANRMRPRGTSGVWERFVEGVEPGMAYKYAIDSNYGKYHVEKADPYGFAAEPRPRTASVVCDLSSYAWNDGAWMAHRQGNNSLGAPISIYEVHLGSWMRGEGNRWLTYQELAPKLAEYVHEMGFTHVEFMPVAEHPFDGSWGYQVTGYFAPTSRFGSPMDFMAMVDLLHQHDVGVIIDWVPAHFPTDGHALGYFDGTHLYEHSDPRQGFHPDWDTFIFNYGRPEVANFLISNALFWLDKYHIDGLRVDAVASMLYRDYSREKGEWIANELGGRENLEAIALLKRVNELIHVQFPGVLTIAEESTSWPKVTRPPSEGGLGFDLKWDMGWMHDTLDYFQKDPIYRKHHHNQLTFRGLYAYSENFVLPLSHDEVVYGKGSLLNKMPGDAWRKFANVRLLFGYQFALPGKKMLFMGDDFGPWNEWSHDSSLDWHLLGEPMHAGLRRWVRDLNTLYRGSPELHELDHSPEGFTWIDASDAEQSVLSFVRKGHSTNAMILFVANFTPIPRINYRVGVPRAGHWPEILNGDADLYGGSGQGNIGGVSTTPVRAHGHEQSLNLTLPPLAVIALRSPGG